MRHGTGDGYGLANARPPWANTPKEKEKPIHYPDPQEEIETCMSCPLRGCHPTSERCPLFGRKRGDGTKLDGTADKRHEIAQDNREKMERIYRMTMDGWTTRGIARELGIDIKRVKYWKIKLRQEGRLY
jgi:hypothetical protein